MTTDEVAKLIKLNFTLYKLGAKPLTEEEMEDMLMVWTYHFKDYPSNVVKKAFLDANKKCEYPITPKNIFDHMPKESLTKSWEQLKQAINKAQKYVGWRVCPMLVGIDEHGRPIKSDGSRELEDLFTSLPPTCQEYLGSPSALVDITEIPPNELEQYERPKFMKLTPEPLTGEQVREQIKLNAAREQKRIG